MNRSGFVIVDNGLHAVGLNDKDGNELLPCVYDAILDYDDDGYIRFIKDRVYGTIDLSGKIIIPLTLKITHLGVFHNGTARAQKNNDKWGLVDEQGNEVGEFRYRHINAHYGDGYKAYLPDDTVGFLAEDGQFTSYEKKEKSKPRFRHIGAYRRDVAPACLWKGGWVFIDRDQQRVNDIEYWSVDPVLRQNVYSVAKGPNQYGVARYDGTLIADEWFTHPLTFDELGLAVCDRLYLDENGNEVRMLGGQPRYDYGILKTDGTFLFPMVYSALHWNDYTTRDCWFAEDDNACYLLFPDGSRRIYRKNSAIRGRGLPSIPFSEYENYISEEVFSERDCPTECLTQHYHRFSEDFFSRYLLIMRWPGVQYEKGLRIHDPTPLSFFYRDTDATIDYDFYRVGRMLRAGTFLESTDKIGRPVHKTRFVIATSLDLDKVDFLGKYIDLDKLPYKGNVIHYNACFLVVDVYVLRGVTQILLLQVPHAALVMAINNRVNIKSSASFSYLDPLVKRAREDLSTKMSSMIHGHSLTTYWTHAMHHPIGLSTTMRPIHLRLQQNYRHPSASRDEQLFHYHYTRILDEQEKQWKQHHFEQAERSVIKVVVGDIKKLFVDAIVSTEEPSLLGNRVGKSKVVEAGGMPCLKIIHTRGPKWHDGTRREAKTLASCYTTAMTLANQEKLHSLAFPGTIANDYPQHEAVQIAVNTIIRNLRIKRFEGDVIICCHNNNEAQIYIDTITTMQSHRFAFCGPTLQQ